MSAPYLAAVLMGRCRTGHEGGGAIVHAVPASVLRGSGWGRAACGKLPGRTSAGWSEAFDHTPQATVGSRRAAVTCGKCRGIAS